jgi:hypothetical protein
MERRALLRFGAPLGGGHRGEDPGAHAARHHPIEVTARAVHPVRAMRPAAPGLASPPVRPAAPADAIGWRRRLRDAVDAHLGSRDVARVIYGAIIGLALVVAVQAHPPTAGVVAGAIVGTAVAVGLAEIYSELVSLEARTRRPAGRSELRTMVGESLAVVFGAGFPAVFFLLAAADVIDRHLAFVLSKWTGLGLICGYGFLAARLSGSGNGRALVHAVAVGAIGGGLIALKALLH